MLAVRASGGSPTVLSTTSPKEGAACVAGAAVAAGASADAGRGSSSAAEAAVADLISARRPSTWSIRLLSLLSSGDSSGEASPEAANKRMQISPHRAYMLEDCLSSWHARSPCRCLLEAAAPVRPLGKQWRARPGTPAWLNARKKAASAFSGCATLACPCGCACWKPASAGELDRESIAFHLSSSS